MITRPSLRPPPLRGILVCLLSLWGIALSGCGGTQLETDYGHARDKSLNGTGVFAELLRREGHTVRSAVRLTDDLDEWADVIVRFAPYPGPPEVDEANWYRDWLTQTEGRRLIYVPYDYNATADYWDAVRDRLPEPKGNAPSLRDRAGKLREPSRLWSDHLPPKAKHAADADDWFAVDPTKGSPVVCKTLGGPWARGIDPARARLTRHETLKVGAETVLLEGDGKPLAIEWTRSDNGRVLVVANGSFLLNAPLTEPARRPLAWRAARWAAPAPSNVAFVEGPYVVGNAPAPPSLFTLLLVPPFGWVAAQLLALGLAACLARAPRLGRPRSEPASGEDRPAAHPEALGLLLARTGRGDDARAILEAYRRWRHPSQHPRLGHSSTAREAPEPTQEPRSPENE